jgi:hypothetical protein
MAQPEPSDSDIASGASTVARRGRDVLPPVRRGDFGDSATAA